MLSMLHLRASNLWIILSFSFRFLTPFLVFLLVSKSSCNTFWGTGIYASRVLQKLFVCLVRHCGCSRGQRKSFLCSCVCDTGAPCWTGWECSRQTTRASELCTAIYLPLLVVNEWYRWANKGSHSLGFNSSFLTSPSFKMLQANSKSKK